MRRSTFAISGAAALLAPAAVQAQSQKAVMLGTAPNEDALGAVWARDSGAFTRAGLDVTIQKANSGSAVAAAVAGKALDIGKSNIFSVVTAHARGLPFVIIAPAGFYDGNRDAAPLCVPVNSSFKTAADLNGKVMGAPGLDDLTVITVKGWVDKHGGNSSTIKFVEMPNGAIAASIASGRIDMGVLEEPSLSTAIAKGQVKFFCDPMNSVAPRFLWAAYYATRDYAAANADTVRAFRKAIVEASTYINGHHSETVDALARFTGMDAAVIASMPRATLGTALSDALVQPVIDVAAAYKVIPERFSASTMIA
jgi:NitT/TauT family transport system substrate-binding protein